MKAFFFLVLPHVSVPLDMAPGEEQPIKQGCQRQISFSCCLLLQCLSRAETHLGKEGLAFHRFISLHMPFHLSSSCQGNQIAWMKMRKTLVRALFCFPLSLSLSRAKTGLPGLGSLPRGCWDISKVLICLISQGLWKIRER